ncbi:MAG: TIGR03013 family PEP-CTERM/XrtA system glycosyltransferase [Vicinamibacteraceae bacterium]|nr:TIGR03013 family PEP-CTERM/XrtA system glycosyltransferase [Vicinamibacteraceae bacterium]
MAAVILKRLTWRTLVLILFETALILGAVAAAVVVRLGSENLFDHSEPWVYKALIIAAVCQTCLYYAELYDTRVVRDKRELFVRLLQALGVASLILGFVYYLVPDWVIGRGVFLIAAGLIVTFVIGWRVAFEWLTGHVGPRERLLLVGTSAAAVALARELHDLREELGVDIVGFIDPDQAKVGESLLNPGVIGTVADIPEIVRDRRVDRVVVSLADARGRLPMDTLLEMKLSQGVTFDHLASVYEEYTGKIAVENLRPSWLIFSSGFRTSRVTMAAKRAGDAVFAALGLVIAAPVMLLVAAAIKLTSPGPALYHQVRVGLQGRHFTIHKFRSMRTDAEAGTGAVWAQQNDDRITPVGRIIRKTRLDELPQLWNVLRGDMSFVGPRPERPEFVSSLSEQIPFYGQRHVVKPGVTGWAQVCYTYGASVEDALEKLQYDLFYIKHLSLALDLFVIFKTIQTVVLRRGT